MAWGPAPPVCLCHGDGGFPGVPASWAHLGGLSRGLGVSGNIRGTSGHLLSCHLPRWLGRALFSSQLPWAGLPGSPPDKQPRLVPAGRAASAEGSRGTSRTLAPPGTGSPLAPTLQEARGGGEGRGGVAGSILLCSAHVANAVAAAVAVWPCRLAGLGPAAGCRGSFCDHRGRLLLLSRGSPGPAGPFPWLLSSARCACSCPSLGLEGRPHPGTAGLVPRALRGQPLARSWGA